MYDGLRIVLRKYTMTRIFGTLWRMRRQYVPGPLFGLGTRLPMALHTTSSQIFKQFKYLERMLLTIRSECKLLWLVSSAGLGGNRESLVVLMGQQPTGFTLTGQKWPFDLTNRIIVTSAQNSMLKFMPSVQP